MAEQFSKQLFLKRVLPTALALCVSAFLFYKYHLKNRLDSDPVIGSYQGQPITLRDAEVNMSEQEKAGNTIRYKQQRALNTIKENLIKELAQKDGKAPAEFIQKIKSEASVDISKEELADFLRSLRLDPKKISNDQLNNVIGNMKEQKRELYFQRYMDKALADKKIEWKNFDTN
ncbi:MAG: hypothetical protein ACK5P7_03305 [Bdellovibrio sp.]